jgi:hypothetical protein
MDLPGGVSHGQGSRHGSVWPLLVPRTQEKMSKKIRQDTWSSLCLVNTHPTEDGCQRVFTPVFSPVTEGPPSTRGASEQAEKATASSLALPDRNFCDLVSKQEQGKEKSNGSPLSTHSKNSSFLSKVSFKL